MMEPIEERGSIEIGYSMSEISRMHPERLIELAICCYADAEKARKAVDENQGIYTRRVDLLKTLLAEHSAQIRRHVEDVARQGIPESGP